MPGPTKIYEIRRQIIMTAEQDNDLRAFAIEKDITVSEAIRRAIERLLDDARNTKL